MSPKLADLIERVSWTFLQAIAGTIAAAGTASQLNTFDWRAALIGGGVAAAIAAVKVLLGQALNAGATPAVADMAREVLLDLIDELFPQAAPEVAAVRAATATATAAPVTPVVTASAPSAPAPVVTVTTAAPAGPPLFSATSAPVQAAPTATQAMPVAAPAPAPAPAPVNPAALAALSAQQPTP